jgi:hypothetical protein
MALPTGTPTVLPILTGGTTTSILSTAFACGAATWAAGAVNGTPALLTATLTGSTFTGTAPFTIDANVVAAGTATTNLRYVVYLLLP